MLFLVCSSHEPRFWVSPPGSKAKSRRLLDRRLRCRARSGPKDRALVEGRPRSESVMPDLDIRTEVHPNPGRVHDIERETEIGGLEGEIVPEIVHRIPRLQR